MTNSNMTNSNMTNSNMTNSNMTNSNAWQPFGSNNAKRLLLGIGAPLVAVAVIVGPILLWSGRLPDPINISWAASGEPKNPSTLSRFLGLQATFAVACSVGFIIGAARNFRRPTTNGMVAVVAGAVAPVLAVNSVSTLLANTDKAEWTDAQAPGLLWLAISLTAAALGTVLTGWLVRDLLSNAAGAPMEKPSAGLDLTATTTASWHSTASARWPLLAATVSGVVGLVLLAASANSLGDISLVLGLGVLAAAVATLAFASIRVDVDRHGVTVTYGWLGWPRSRVDIDEIAGADAIDVDPREHGGWGYRGSRRLLKKAAIVIRRGDGLRLALRDGSELVVTVDNAEQGAGVINDLRNANTNL